IFSSSWLFSRVVTKTEVETAALNWVKLENNLKNLRLNKFDVRTSTIRELTYRDTLIGYIVDLEPKGFILIPAVSELAPVKFISFSGDYDGSEEHPFIETLKYRLYFTVTNLGYLRGAIPKTSDLVPSEVDTSQKEKNEGAWEKILTEDFSPEIYISAVYLNSVSPMLTSKWNQTHPYNACCPELNGQRCVAGCMATAQAQVMYYWEYPTTGQGVNSYSWRSVNEYLSADFNHEYYWDRMFDSYTGSESQEQIDAVARLMFDVGLARNMNYGLTGSFTAPNRNNSLVAFFKYSQDVRFINRADYVSWADWFDVFKEQMEHGWPVLLYICGIKSGDSHAVAVDGYRVEAGVNQVHVNMGWGGLADDYYSIDNIYDMGSIEIDSALINIYPPDCT
ncbi:C10 family peptidase, partial [bacterium]|nr:C10 family peptidase [bacterium]